MNVELELSLMRLAAANGRTFDAPAVYLDTKIDVPVGQFVENAPWEKRTSARHEAFWSTRPDPYTYGKGAGVRTYHPHPFPQWMDALRYYIETLTQCRFQLCFLNRYDDQHQHLHWHADDSPEQDHTHAPIVVQSFGAERELWMRPNPGPCYACNGSGKYDNDGSPPCSACDGTGKEPPRVEKVLLQHGSTLVMLPGMQHTHQHRIPKHPQPCGTRVSLTWRALK